MIGVAFEHAFKWLGFGAKTAVGYGAMEKYDKAASPKSNAEQTVTGASDRRSATAEVRWEKARIKFNRANGTVTVESAGKQAHALGEAGMSLLNTLPAEVKAKIIRGEFVQVAAIVTGGQVVRLEPRA